MQGTDVGRKSGKHDKQGDDEAKNVRREDIV